MLIIVFIFNENYIVAKTNVTKILESRLILHHSDSDELAGKSLLILHHSDSDELAGKSLLILNSEFEGILTVAHDAEHCVRVHYEQAVHFDLSVMTCLFCQQCLNEVNEAYILIVNLFILWTGKSLQGLAGLGAKLRISRKSDGSAQNCTGAATTDGPVAFPAIIQPPIQPEVQLLHPAHHANDADETVPAHDAE
jgi:hypothetical protein